MKIDNNGQLNLQFYFSEAAMKNNEVYFGLKTMINTR
jgi:hypothetical protein